MLERRSIHNLDWLLTFSVLSLCVVGLGMVYSATAGSPLAPLATKQLVYFGVGLMGLLLALAIDYHTLASLSYLFYAASLILLVYLLFFGRAIANTRGWLELGPVNLQPAEMTKLTTLLALSAFLSRHRSASLTPSNMGGIVLIVAAPVILIARQPDLGTAITFVPLVAVAAFLGGMRLRTILILIMIPILAFPILWKHYLKDYQKTRVVTFLNPAQDPKGAGYQVLQSRIAVGSGGLTGKGFLEGTQGQLKFLPAQHTDFIFALMAEERGFLGSLVVLSLYFVVIYRCIAIARAARDILGVYLAMGVMALFACQVLINIGVVLGLMPTTGVPLPLMSYGGSSLITTLAGMGLVLNVWMRRLVN
ncbi:MAG: rod shape-determining protein RodA [Acidobacteria bacterium]|nr:MAG: rod shape-determining protein RodA [Acidobacteriota bacterium]